MDGNILTFSAEQVEAIEKVSRWLKSGTRKKQVFRLFGYAGTGKTTIIRHLTAELGGIVAYAAFTGKAALMMARNGCQGASTVHSLIYRVVDGTALVPTFELNPDSVASMASLIVLDECSMVDEQMARDLMSFGKPILVLGDPAQLPPIEGEGYFTRKKPDVLLTEVRRQSLDSPILRLATDVREGRGLPYGVFGTSRILSRKDIVLDEILAADQFILGRNVMRRYYNEEIRQALGFSGDLPMVGDKLICLRNDHRKGIFNGGMFRVLQVSAECPILKVIRLRLASLDLEDAPEILVSILPEVFRSPDKPWSTKELKSTQVFDFGYAITAHKSQGSQWRNVVVLDESDFFEGDPTAWLYTAITRAAERVTVFS